MKNNFELCTKLGFGNKLQYNDFYKQLQNFASNNEILRELMYFHLKEID